MPLSPEKQAEIRVLLKNNLASQFEAANTTEQLNDVILSGIDMVEDYATVNGWLETEIDDAMVVLDNYADEWAAWHSGGPKPNGADSLSLSFLKKDFMGIPVWAIALTTGVVGAFAYSRM